MERTVVSIPDDKNFINKKMKILSILFVALNIMTFALSTLAIYYFDGDLLEEEVVGRQLALISLPLSFMIIYFMYKLRKVTGFKVLLYWTIFYTVYNFFGIYFYANPIGFSGERNNSFNGAILLLVYMPLIFLAFYRYETRTLRLYFVSLLFLSTAYSPFAYYNIFSFYTEIFLRNYISAFTVVVLAQGYFYQFLFFGLLNSIVLIRLYYLHKKDDYIYKNSVVVGDLHDFLRIKAIEKKEKELKT